MRKPLVATVLLLVSAALALATGLSRLPAFPAAGRGALDQYLVAYDYTIHSTQLAPMPQNFGGVCSVYTSTITELWCVYVSGGPEHLSHFVLHSDDSGWAVVPVFDFDRAVFEAIGCTNW